MMMVLDVQNKNKGSYHKSNLDIIIEKARLILITVLSDNVYTDCDTKIKVSCNVCGLEFYQTSYKISKKIGCPHCAKSGENNPAWRGGWRKKDYVMFTEKVKRYVRDRDANKCQSSFCKTQLYGKSLDVHHIDGDKKNSKSENLISLCHSCHSVIEQNNPKDWIQYFKEKVQENEGNFA
jgi:hypothetical protein